jgi:phosphatidylserine/phosphatidylglycerophosphate/cardiolipin synthase-like enzyme
MTRGELSAELDKLWDAGTDLEEDAQRRSAEERLGSLLAKGADPGGPAAELASWVKSLASTVDRVSLVATGLAWLGGGTRSVEQALLSLISGATDEILVTAYSVTGGSSRVMDAIARRAAAGVRCVFIVNRLSEQPFDTRAVLRELRGNFQKNVFVYSFEDATSIEGLHAKVVVVDRKDAIVGSANLSFHGMTSGHELGLLVRGPTASVVASAIDLLLDTLHASYARL